MVKVDNWRTKEVTMGMGKDVKDTKQLSGEASQTAAEKSMNSTTEYSTANNPQGGGALGGKNSGL